MSADWRQSRPMRPHANPSRGRELLRKVPEVTLYFWIIKVLCTTVGETAADYLDTNFGLGLTNTTFITAGVLTVALIFQFRSYRYVPWIYWLVVVLVSVVGTQITDNLVDNFGVSLVTTTVVFAVALHLRARHRGGRPGGRAPQSRLRGLGAGLCRGDRGRRPRALPARARGDHGLLARVHPDPAARRVARRLPVAAGGQWRPRSRDDGDERALPGHDRDRRGVPDDHEERRARLRSRRRRAGEGRLTPILGEQ